MKQSQKTTLMQLQFSLAKQIAITVLIMLSLIGIVYCFNIPNPNMILIVGLVLCSALFGFGGGIVAAVIMLFYTLYFFSTDHSFTQFTAQNLQKVGVSLVGVVTDTLLVCSLKRAEVQAFHEIEALTVELHRENELLQSISLTDALTGIRNRMALRQDYDAYVGRELTVMMLDLDYFKQINDALGHDAGDHVLRQTAKLLADAFDEAHCYRYGGDEFLVLYPDAPEAVFREKLDELLLHRPVLELEGGRVQVDYSCGCVHAVPDDAAALHRLISEADKRMYQLKRGKRRNDAYFQLLSRKSG